MRGIGRRIRISFVLGSSRVAIRPQLAFFWRWLINLPVLTDALPFMEKNGLLPEDRFDGPTLFVLGGRSRYAEAGDHALMRRYFPHAQIEVIADSGHNPHMDAREEFVRLLTKAG